MFQMTDKSMLKFITHYLKIIFVNHTDIFTVYSMKLVRLQHTTYSKNFHASMKCEKISMKN